MVGSKPEGQPGAASAPLTEAQVFRFYLMSKIHVEAALRSLGGRPDDPDVRMLEG